MRITLVGPVHPYRGGITHFHSSLAQALTDSNHEIQVVSFQRQYIHWLYPGKTDKDNSQDAIKIPALFTLDPVKIWTWYRAIRQIKDFNPDVIIFQWWTTFWSIPYYLIINHLRKNFALILIVHNAMPHEQKFFDRFFTKSVFNKVNTFVTLSDEETKRLKDQLSESKQVFTIEHPIYDNMLNLKIPKNLARKKLNIPESRKLLLFFGFIRPYKGLVILLDALKQIKSDEYFLIIAGECWGDASQYLDFIRENHLEEITLFQNRYIPNEELAVYLSAADVFVAPYIGGTQSGTIKLAMGFGLPIIATDAIVSKNVVSTYSGLQIIPAGDSTKLADAIQNWIPPSVSEQKLDSSLSWEHFVSELERIVKAKD